MPRIPRLERVFVKRQNQWSPYPKRAPPFYLADWRKIKVNRTAIVRKARPPCQIPKITPYTEWPIIRGDLVEVMVGPDTGKQGKVRAVARKKNLIKVMGMNLQEEFVDNLGEGQSGYMLLEQPLHYSEVKLVDPVTGKGTDVFIHSHEEGGDERVCKQSGRVIPKPPFERVDFKRREDVPVGDNDTKPDIARQYTYVPSLLLFHEEIMKEMKIPMTLRKTQLERRDLIMKEIEEDLVREAEEERKLQPNVESKGIFDQLKDVANNVMFWRK